MNVVNRMYQLIAYVDADKGYLAEAIAENKPMGKVTKPGIKAKNQFINLYVKRKGYTSPLARIDVSTLLNKALEDNYLEIVDIDSGSYLVATFEGKKLLYNKWGFIPSGRMEFSSKTFPETRALFQGLFKATFTLLCALISALAAVVFTYYRGGI